MSFFSSSLVVFALLINFLNSGFLLKVKHRHKLLATIVLWSVSIGLFILARYLRLFVLTLLASLIAGAGTSLGEVTILGFMKCLPPLIISGFSTGTGLGGFLGATLYFGLKSFDVSINATLLSILPFYPIYALSFCMVLRMQTSRQTNDHEKESYLEKTHSQISFLITNEPQEELSDEKNLLEKKSTKDAQTKLEEHESQMNIRLTWNNFKIVQSKAGGLFAAYSFMYFLIFISITSVSSKIQSKYKDQYSAKSTPQTVVLLFEILQVAYQMGHFLTGASLDFFQIKRVWSIIASLLVFTVVFLIQVFLPECPPIWVPIATIFIVGAIGGLGYVNIYHQILSHPAVSKQERELALNINVMMSNLCIILSSIVGYFCSLAWNTS